LRLHPSHTTGHTGPYPAVRRIERTPAPAEGVTAEVWKPTTAKALRSLLCRAVRLHRSALTCRTDITACSAAWRLRVVRVYSLLPTVRAFGRIAPPTMPSADFCAAVRSPCDDLSLVAETQRRPPEVRPTAFAARPPDLPPRPLMTVDFAIACSLVRPGRPRYPVFVHRAATLLHASFRRHLATTPLRFANPSPPSGWIEDFHLQAVDHARHTNERAALPRPFLHAIRFCVGLS
jgi:hypothetical protein